MVMGTSPGMEVLSWEMFYLLNIYHAAVKDSKTLLWGKKEILELTNFFPTSESVGIDNSPFHSGICNTVDI